MKRFRKVPKTSEKHAFEFEVFRFHGFQCRGANPQVCQSKTGS